MSTVSSAARASRLIGSELKKNEPLPAVHPPANPPWDRREGLMSMATGHPVVHAAMAGTGTGAFPPAGATASVSVSAPSSASSVKRQGMIRQ